MTKLRVLLVACLLLSLGFASGCVTESTAPVGPVTTNQHPILRATITGKIIDACTMKAIAGAVVSVGYDGGVTSKTSDASGSFSFGDIPVSRYEEVNGSLVANDVYLITASLVNFNKAQTDSTKRYRDYYYHPAILTYTTAADSSQLVGLIGSVTFMITERNTTLRGKVVDRDQQNVAGAVVTLFDQTINAGAVIAQAKTNATGDYAFSNIDNGIGVSLKAISADGTMSGSYGTFGIPCNLPYDSLRAQVVAEHLVVTPSDDVAPTVIGVSPVNAADVDPTSLTVVYTFSEPIKQTPYTRTDLGLGHATIMDDIKVTYNGMKKSAADIGFSAAWNATLTQLTITPSGIVGSAKYAVNFTVAANSGKIQDMAGNGLVNNTNLTGDFELLNFTTNGLSAVPAAPTLVRRLIPGVYTDLDFAGGSVSLEWNSDAAARSYNLYRKIGNGPFELLQKDVFNIRYIDTAPALVAPYNPVGGVRDPLGALTVQYQVKAVSRDLVEGSASNAITVSDVVKPRMTAATRGAALATNLYPFTLSFSEPISATAAETIANFTFSNTSGVTYTVQRADYMGYNPGLTAYVVRLTVATSAVPVAGAVLTIGNNVVDLAGNSIDSAFNSATF